MTPSAPPAWAFEIGDRFKFAVGDCMGGVEFGVVNRAIAKGMRTYVFLSCDPDQPFLMRIETEATLLAMRGMESILGEVDR